MKTSAQRIEDIDAVQIEHRSFELNLRLANAETRTVDASVSSEEPYVRAWGIEILDHTQDSVDLSRARKKLSLLLHHDQTKIIGVAENFRLIDKRLYATLRFGKSQEAEEAWTDVQEGVLRHISVGYTIETLKHEGGETYRALRWSPHEVSVVAIPADVTVGIGRSTSFERLTSMTQENNKPPIVNTARADAARVADILAIARRFNAFEDAETAIRDGATVQQFQERMLEAIGSPNGTVPRNNSMNSVGLSHENTAEADALKGYSLGRAVAAMVTGSWDGAGREREISQELSRRSGRKTDGVFIPSTALLQRATMVAAGNNLVGTEHMPDAFIDALVPFSVVLLAGATRMTGLTQNASIPRCTGLPTAAWIAEDAPPGESNSAYDAVTLSPKQCSAQARYSKKLLVQSLPSVEELLRKDLTGQIARAIDLGAIMGTGAVNQPRGVLNVAGVGNVALGVNGLAPSWDMIVDLLGEVAIDNAMGGTLGYVSNTKVMTKLQKTSRQTGGTEGNYILAESTDKLNGFKSFWSNQVPRTLTKGTSNGICSAMIFGNWADLLIGEWGMIDLTVDPYTDGAKGNVMIYAHSFVDIAVRHPESFAICTDILA